jgi:tight adherence protein B
MEVLLLSTVLIGLAVGIFAWAGEELIQRGLDVAAADFRVQLKRLRMGTKYVRQLLAVWWGGLVGLALVLWLVFDLTVLGIVISLMLAALPWYLVRRWAFQRRQLIEDQMADAMVSLASAIKAGLSLAQSLEILAQQSPRPNTSWASRWNAAWMKPARDSAAKTSRSSRRRCRPVAKAAAN